MFDRRAASVCVANLERTHGCLRPPSPPVADTSSLFTLTYYLFYCDLRRLYISSVARRALVTIYLSSLGIQ